MEIKFTNFEIGTPLTSSDDPFHAALGPNIVKATKEQMGRNFSDQFAKIAAKIQTPLDTPEGSENLDTVKVNALSSHSDRIDPATHSASLDTLVLSPDTQTIVNQSVRKSAGIKFGERETGFATNAVLTDNFSAVEAAIERQADNANDPQSSRIRSLEDSRILENKESQALPLAYIEVDPISNQYAAEAVSNARPVGLHHDPHSLRRESLKGPLISGSAEKQATPLAHVTTDIATNENQVSNPVAGERFIEAANRGKAIGVDDVHEPTIPVPKEYASLAVKFPTAKEFSVPESNVERTNVETLRNQQRLISQSNIDLSFRHEDGSVRQTRIDEDRSTQTTTTKVDLVQAAAIGRMSRNRISPLNADNFGNVGDQETITEVQSMPTQRAVDPAASYSPLGTEENRQHLKSQSTKQFRFAGETEMESPVVRRSLETDYTTYQEIDEGRRATKMDLTGVLTDTLDSIAPSAASFHQAATPNVVKATSFDWHGPKFVERFATEISDLTINGDLKKFEINPRNLGRLEIALVARGTSEVIQIDAESQAAKDVIVQHSQAIQEMLKAQGRSDVTIRVDIKDANQFSAPNQGEQNLAQQNGSEKQQEQTGSESKGLNVVAANIIPEAATSHDEGRYA